MPAERTSALLSDLRAAANLQEVVVVSTQSRGDLCRGQRASGRAKVGLSIRRQLGFFECGSGRFRGSRFPSLRPPKRGLRASPVSRGQQSGFAGGWRNGDRGPGQEGVSASSGQRNRARFSTAFSKALSVSEEVRSQSGIGRSSTSVGAVALMGRKDFRRRFHPADRPDHRRGKNG